ncbi:hypothetical protein BH160DRAFT_2058 [Burkholderia sp. H160]|nr:hypothetical protein BH160DRAFT_2058 [Burkholderia sp. H160]
MVLTCFAVRHRDDDHLLQLVDHNVLQAIADDASIRFEPGFAGNSLLEVPRNEDAKQTVEALLEQNHLSFSVVTCIAY